MSGQIPFPPQEPRPRGLRRLLPGSAAAAGAVRLVANLMTISMIVAATVLYIQHGAEERESSIRMQIAHAEALAALPGADSGAGVQPLMPELDAQERALRSSRSGTSHDELGKLAWSPGEDGTYRAAGEELAAVMGVSIIEADGPGDAGACEGVREGSRSPVAWYCALEPDVIRFDASHEQHVDLVRDPVYLDIVRHELAHRSVFLRCGAEGRVDEGIEESVANAYASQYLGAVETALDAHNAGNPGYLTTPLSRLVAQRIADGACWAR